MSLIELKAFDAVARAGGFVQGADLLRRAQPTVTTQIRALEIRYGVELFFRSRGQSARLTPIGQRLFETTRALFALEVDADTILSDATEGVHGVLRIAAIAPRSAMRLVSRFCKLHPHMRIEMRNSNSGQVMSWLRDYDVDIGILGAHERDPAFVMERFSTPEIVLLASADFKTDRTGKVSRERFAHETLVLRERGSETLSLVETALAQHGYHPARVFEIASREGVWAAAEAGLGLAPISIDEIDLRSSAQVVRFEDFTIFGEMFLACMNNRRHIPLMRKIFALDRRGKRLP